MNNHSNYYYYYVGDCWLIKIAAELTKLRIHICNCTIVILSNERRSNSYFGAEAIIVFHILHVHINLQNSNMSPTYSLHTKSLSDLSMLKSVGRFDLFCFVSNFNFLLPDIIYLYTFIITVNVPCKINLTLICRNNSGF